MNWYRFDENGNLITGFSQTRMERSIILTRMELW